MVAGEHDSPDVVVEVVSRHTTDVRRGKLNRPGWKVLATRPPLRLPALVRQ